ncbi:hypothetical protein FALBO_16003 [Fusarium albosuccineum]|uniref:Uncharacterized protein n=1 Tax=Fusarium albosuccineum TaxID=1237068 RepID=A0A8H4P174_9HYPO|nr:hypothetical protein FALBO_16003 [Fusarium albosuccineum]
MRRMRAPVGLAWEEDERWEMVVMVRYEEFGNEQPPRDSDSDSYSGNEQQRAARWMDGAWSLPRLVEVCGSCPSLAGTRASWALLGAGTARHYSGLRAPSKAGTFHFLNPGASGQSQVSSHPGHSPAPASTTY